MWYAAVCGGSCGQKRSQSFAGNDFPVWTGSVFHPSDCLHCNSEGGIQQVFSAPSTPQKLGGCKQKDTLSPSRRPDRFKTNILMMNHALHPRFSPARSEGTAPPPWKRSDIFSRRYSPAPPESERTGGSTGWFPLCGSAYQSTGHSPGPRPPGARR